MCVVSMVGDHYSRKWEQWPNYPSPNTPIYPYAPSNIPQITREEFDALKRDVLEMKELLKAAKKYDEEHGEPDCEMDDKLAILRKVAEMVGVDLEDIFG